MAPGRSAKRKPSSTFPENTYESETVRAAIRETPCPRSHKKTPQAPTQTLTAKNRLVP